MIHKTNFVKTEKVSSQTFTTEEYYKNYFGTEILEKLDHVPNLNSESQQLLKMEGKNIDLEKIISNNLIFDNSMKREVTRSTFETFEIEIDDKGDIVKYTNFDDYSTEDKDKKDYIEDDPLPKIEYILNSKDDLNEFVNTINNTIDLSAYELVACNGEIEGSWILSWCKKYGEVINRFECVTITLDSKDGSIIIFSKNNLKPDTFQPNITQEEAISNAQDTILKFNSKVKSVELSVVKPNYFDVVKSFESFDNIVNLAWVIYMENDSMIYVDACSGEILGGNGVLSTDYARAMQVVEGTGRVEKVNAASSGLTTLGFNQTGYPPVTWNIAQADINWQLSRPNVYGLYLCSHGFYLGDKCTLSGEDLEDGSSEWEIDSDSSYGNWHFVFLDACFSGRDGYFANSFHATTSGRCLVGWYSTISWECSYTFCMHFWSAVGSETVWNNVVDSRQYCWDNGYSGGGSNYCNPTFNGDQYYWGWSWWDI